MLQEKPNARVRDRVNSFSVGAIFHRRAVTGTGKMRVAKLRVGILRVEVRASTRLVSYF